ncbi:MAG: hypothetical protein U5M51_08755 [Emticicia sp.]|nr:hypothetical protein [Emticicia sp.]
MMTSLTMRGLTVNSPCCCAARGREAFPGDIFYVHSRLLERATHLRPSFGGGSLTALPIIETEAQNMSAYIPTNLISITDTYHPSCSSWGYYRKAVDVGRSVSRVGSKAQLADYRKVAGNLELEGFARFGTRLDDNARKILARRQHPRLFATN